MQPATHPHERTSRPRVTHKEFTMEDMRKRLDQQDSIIHGIRGDTQIQAGALQAVQKAMEGFAKDLSTIAQAIGEEKEDGQGNYLGTGLLGRTRRVERAQRSLRELYHRWIAFGTGFIFCGGAMIVAIWWLVGDKVAIVLKGTTGH